MVFLVDRECDDNSNAALVERARSSAQEWGDCPNGKLITQLADRIDLLDRKNRKMEGKA